MNLEEQIRQIRAQKNEEYSKYISKIETENNEEIEKQKNIETHQKKLDILTSLRCKYFSKNNSMEKAATTIQKFVKKYYFEPTCINNDEINDIPPIYRIRILITDHHINEYYEENVEPNIIGMHRIIYNMVRPVDKIIYFRYCFDIRKLYPIRHQIIEVCDSFYFLQPEDHIKINTLWKKVNNETSKSIRFINSFEYYKSLSIDMHDNEPTNTTNELDTSVIKNQIEDILTGNEPVDESLDSSTNESVDEFSVEIDLDREYLNEITRQYFNNFE